MVIVEGGLGLLVFRLGVGCVTEIMSSRVTINWHIRMES